MAERTETTFRLRYRVEASIAAPAPAIWARLVDGPRYPSWNSTVERLEGEIAVGRRLALRVPAAPGRVFRPRVVELIPERRMVWRDGLAPIFQGTRTFALTPGSGGEVRFEMAEEFRGAMLPLAKGSLPDFREAFDRFAEDLKRACEGR
jgi:hypothetical protein